MVITLSANYSIHLPVALFPAIQGSFHITKVTAICFEISF